jgi:hypothetical protein
MIILGFILLALAVAAAIVLIAQNPDAMMTFHALGNTYTTHAYWIFVGGMVVLAVAAIGLSMMRSGAAHGARVRRERRDLAAENARLSERVTEAPVERERVVETTADDGRYVDRAPAADHADYADRDAVEQRRHAWSRRAHHGTV